MTDSPTQSVPERAKVVVIGAGIVGNCLVGPTTLNPSDMH